MILEDSGDALKINMSIVLISLRANKYCQQYTMLPPPPLIIHFGMFVPEQGE